MISVDITAPGWPKDAEAIAQTAAQATKDHLAKPGPQSLVIRLSDDAEVKTLNAQYRDQDKPTNVLSFPAPPPTDQLHAGDLILAYETCAREAHEQAKTLADHLSHLVVHGVLHLYGFDHMVDTEAEEMETLERVILARLNIKDPYA